MKKFFFPLALPLIFILCISSSVPKQARPFIAKGDTYFAQDDYENALKNYMEAFKTNAGNANLCYKIGVCCLNIPAQKHNAENYLFVAANNVTDDYNDNSIKEVQAPPSAFYYYGQALHLNNKFDDAIGAFVNYKKYIDTTDKKTMNDLNLRMAWCMNGKKLVANPVSIQVKNLGPGINTQWPEYSPVISADQKTLIFTSRRPTTTGGQIDPRDGMYYEDIYMSTMTDTGWGTAVPMGNNINTAGNEATIGLSPDGQQLLIYKDDAGDGNIYISQLNGDQWGTPQKLTDYVNSKSWEPSACITPDGNTLYFTSNRDGGFGGRDLYRSVKLPNGQWSKPTNLGPKINTPYDEDAPAILADGKTLYYASNGPQSMGGFDIMYTVFSDDSGWSKPANVGYPVNTSDDDVFFAPTPDNTHAYYSSASYPHGYGEKDICLLTFPEKKQTALTVLEGEITSIFGGVPPNTVITVTDVMTGDIIGQYTPNSATGRYVIILQPGRNYNITYEATDYLYQSDNVNISDTLAYQQINRPVQLEPLKVGQKIVVRNIFFDSGKSQLKPESKNELEKIVTLMNQFPNIILQIAGHTDAAGPDDLNQKLSEQRAQAVADYLVSRGIDKSRLRTIGYGESKPIAINYNPNGTANKQGMALNRRFEFTILSLDGKIKDVVQPIDVPDNLKNKKDGNK